MFNGRISYFSVVVIKHHDQKKFMKNESVFGFNPTGTILGGGVEHSGKLRPHNLNRKLEAEDVNWVRGETINTQGLFPVM